jgi:hypothetical protein
MGWQSATCSLFCKWLLAHSHTHLFPYYLELLWGSAGRAEKLEPRPSNLQIQKIFTLLILHKQFTDFCARIQTQHEGAEEEWAEEESVHERGNDSKNLNELKVKAIGIAQRSHLCGIGASLWVQ